MAYEVMHDMFPGGSSEDQVKKVRDFIKTISKRNMTQTEIDHIEAWFASQWGGEHCWGSTAWSAGAKIFLGCYENYATICEQSVDSWVDRTTDFVAECGHRYYNGKTRRK